MTKARAAIILAAGQGTRMKSALPKVLHAVGGRPMIDWALAAGYEAGASKTVAVIGAHSPEVAAHIESKLGAGSIAVQDPPRGTGHAVLAAKEALAGFDGDVAVLFADTPLVRPETVAALFELRAANGGIAALGFEAADPTGYGRLIRGDDGTITRIVEQKDASEAERKIRLSNSGVLVADCKVLFQLLSMVKNDNAKGEYYLTDIVALGRSSGFVTHVHVGDEAEMLGVNSRIELAEAETAFQQRMRARMLDSGVTMIDPQTVYFSYDTEIEPDVVIEPNVVFALGVSIARGAEIKGFCHLEGAQIGERARIGPYARMRPGAEVGAEAHVGNFVELKKTKMGVGAKANHLAYLGDSVIGARANIGAGAIFCNYDGFDKFVTTIGEDAFVGSNSSMVAPVTIGNGAFVATGTVVTKDVPADARAIAPKSLQIDPGWAAAFRERKRAAKAAKS